MFGLGLPELIAIFLIALLLFGATKLPDIGRSMGKAIKEFKKGVKEISDVETDESETKTDEKKKS